MAGRSSFATHTFAVLLSWYFFAAPSQAVQTIATSPDGFYSLQITDPLYVGNGSETLVNMTLQISHNQSGNGAYNPSLIQGTIGGNGTLHHERPFNSAIPTPVPGSSTSVGQSVSFIDSLFTNVGSVVTIPTEVGTTLDSAEPPQSSPANATVFGPSLDVGLYLLLNASELTDVARLVAKNGDSIEYDIQFSNSLSSNDETQGIRFAGSFVPLDPRLAGDFDADGDVDVSDFGVFSNRRRNPIDDEGTGDFDRDGDIDTADFGVFSSNFGRTVPVLLTGATSVPEPTALVLSCLAVGSLLWCIRDTT